MALLVYLFDLRRFRPRRHACRYRARPDCRAQPCAGPARPLAGFRGERARHGRPWRAQAARARPCRQRGGDRGADRRGLPDVPRLLRRPYLRPLAAVRRGRAGDGCARRGWRPPRSLHQQAGGPDLAAARRARLAQPFCCGGRRRQPAAAQARSGAALCGNRTVRRRHGGLCRRFDHRHRHGASRRHSLCRGHLRLCRSPARAARRDRPDRPLRRADPRPCSGSAEA